MSLEISTAGILLKYCVEATAGTRPTSGYTTIPNIKTIPDFNPAPSNLEVTDLSDTTWKRYIEGLKDPGGSLSFDANFTTAFKSAWQDPSTGLMKAYADGIAATPSKATWFEVYVPNFGSFYFAGTPAELGLASANVDEVFDGSVYITPNQVHGWDTSST